MFIAVSDSALDCQSTNEHCIVCVQSTKYRAYLYMIENVNCGTYSLQTWQQGTAGLQAINLLF
jgi:hypothetical protein